MIVAAGDIGITELTKLANMMYVQGSVPSELNKSLFLAISKVNGSINCGKHHTISLISHVTKLVLRIVINRIIGEPCMRLHRNNMTSCKTKEHEIP